ncbi:Hsp70 family protein [Dactylosporangium cerinum]
MADGAGRLAKELLSAGTSAVVPVAGRGEVTLTPDDLERIATPLVRPTADLTLRVMRDAGVDAASVAGVYLAGGGTRMPLVATLLHRVVGIPPVASGQPELLAAEGSVAVLAAPHPPAATPHPQAVPEVVPDPTVPDSGGPDSGAPDSGEGGRLWDWLPAHPVLISGWTWRDAPFHPLRLGLPSGYGWTIRARFAEPEHTVFLSRGGGPLLFRSVAGLATYLLQAGDHELAGLDGWPAARDLFVSLVHDAGDEDEVDLDLVQYNLGFPPRQWMPDLLVAARDVAVDLAEAFGLQDVIALLAEGSLLDGVDDLLRHADRTLAGRSARRRLDAVDADAVRWDWHAIVTRLDGIIAWAD